MKHEFSTDDIHHVEANQRSYSESDLAEFKRDLIEAGNKIRVLFMEYHLDDYSFQDFFANQNTPVLAFIQENGVKPVLLCVTKKIINVTKFNSSQTSIDQVFSLSSIPFVKNNQGEVEFFAVFAYESPVSLDGQEGEHPSPIKRLLKLLGTERKEIFYILFYAIIIGLIGLVVPLGIQTTVELISGGVFFSSVYIHITLVILGVLLSGALQIVQISLVEFLQRRIFTKASLEFAFRIPRIRAESIQAN